MPINKDLENGSPVFYPSTNRTIIKYLDLTKYLSLLKKQALFFCRLDKLEDAFEGTTTVPHFDYRLNRLKRLNDQSYFNEKKTDQQLVDTVRMMESRLSEMKSVNCVNCWNLDDYESMALWKIYSNPSNGIMIKSSVKKLEKAFELCQEKLDLSVVRYLDYENDPMPGENLMYSMIHKNLAYSYEKELRLIHEVSNQAFKHNWEAEEVEEGVYIKADINTLIEEIIVGPYSPKWFLDLITDLSLKYNLNKPVKASALTR